MTDGLQPAFSEIHIHHFQNEDADGKHDNVVPRWMGGLTKREYFAAMAMQGLRAAALSEAVSEQGLKLWSSSGIAKQALSDADALIAELNR
jgi:hypothetical protein